MQDYEPALAYCKRAQVIATALEDFDLQVLVNQEMGIIYFELGEYRQAMECLQQNLTALQGERHHQSLGSTGAPSVHGAYLDGAVPHRSGGICRWSDLLR